MRDLSPTRKDPEQILLHPYFRLAQIHSTIRRGEKRMETDESKSTSKRTTDRGNKVGALVLVGVKHEHVKLYSNRVFQLKNSL